MTQPDIPNDENGDVLRRMLAHGDDLSMAREINFNVVFGKKKDAQRFVAVAREQGLEAILEDDTTEDGLFDVTINRHMVPDHADITNFENQLEALAGPFGGRNDGWGCFT